MDNRDINGKRYKVIDNVYTSDFEAQLNQLAENGYRVIAVIPAESFYDPRVIMVKED